MIASKSLFAFLFVALAAAPLAAFAKDPRPRCHFERALCGYVDETGAVVIAPAFDEAGGFVAGLAAVTVDGRMGIIDEDGKFIAPGEFEGAMVYPSGHALLYRDGKSRLIDRSGKTLVEAEAQVIRLLDADHVLVGSDLLYFKPSDFDTVLFLREGAWRVRTISSGEENAPVESSVHFVSDDLGLPFWQQIGDEWILTGTDGRILARHFSGGGILANGQLPAQKGGKWGLVDLKGRTIVDFLFDEVRPFGDDKWTIYGADVLHPGDRAFHRAYGYVDRAGNITIPAQFDMAMPFDGDVAKVARGGIPATIDRKGQVANACGNSPIVRKDQDGFRLFKADGTPLNDVLYGYAQGTCSQPTLISPQDYQYGFLDDEGNLLGGRYFPNAHPFYDGVAVVWLEEDVIGIIDVNGDYVVGPLRKKAKIISGGERSVINPGPDHVLVTAELARALARNPTLLTTAPPVKRTYSCQSDRVDIIAKDGTISFVDATGKPFITGAFDYASCFYGRDRTWVAVRDRREWCEIDKKGRLHLENCTCGQPVLILESWDGDSYRPAEGLDCYDAGLDLLAKEDAERKQTHPRRPVYQ